MEKFIFFENCQPKDRFNFGHRSVNVPKFDDRENFANVLFHIERISEQFLKLKHTIPRINRWFRTRFK